MMESRSRPGSASLSKWGLVQGWLAMNLQRRIEMRASPFGLTVIVFDPVAGETSAEMTSEEDPSKVAWRIIAGINQRPG